MRKGLMITVVTVAACAFTMAASADTKKGEKIDGAKEFQEHCAVCHPNGGNTINPKKTLSGKDLKANGVKTANDIIKLTRNPGPGMTKFDKKAVSDKEAKAIADYILKTYK